MPSCRWSLTLIVWSIVGTVVACSQPDVIPALESQSSGTGVRLQAVSAVSDQIVWVGGVGGTFARTVDGGHTWVAGIVPDADSLQFRDVHGVDAMTAYLLSAGPGTQSRIYKTTDGGKGWTLQFVNQQPHAFFDCMGFWDATTGVAFSDAVDGKMLIMRTVDGEHWEPLPADRLPTPLPGEGGFAASGTCLVTFGDSLGWIGTGAAPIARVLQTLNRGATWSAVTTPMPAGEMAGITSVSFRSARVGMAVGGLIGQPDDQSDNVAVTADGGTTWTLGARPTFPGAAYGTSYVPGAMTPTVVTVGPGGASYSLNDGATWSVLDTLDYWGIGFAQRVGWLVGPAGRITKVLF
ncbi:MAG: hypothetical protein OER90_00540 [Gemmatimonadota bacterium]|nr:hypothetical protein [Gemmatimonadota bacterium]